MVFKPNWQSLTSPLKPISICHIRQVIDILIEKIKFCNEVYRIITVLYLDNIVTQIAKDGNDKYFILHNYNEYFT